MRVDGTLMGMDEEAKRMIPQWRRGHFSLLFDASTQPASVFICDHEKKLFANMASKKKARDIDAEVCLVLACAMDPVFLSLLSCKGIYSAEGIEHKPSFSPCMAC